MTFHILLETTSNQGCFAHIPSLPGLCYRADSPEQAHEIAITQIKRYTRWLLDYDLPNLTPESDYLVRQLQTGGISNINIIEKERLQGASVWISGNAAAFFQHDQQVLDNTGVNAHLRFTRKIIEDIGKIVTPLTASQRAWKPASDRRSIDDTLTHIGNCVWWYCSRIDDDFPEPEAPPSEVPLDRINRLIDEAESFLLSVPSDKRAEIRIPKRYPTKNKAEQWTHAKVCRRQAEHAWEHLQFLPRDVEMAMQTE